MLKRKSDLMNKSLPLPCRVCFVYMKKMKTIFLNIIILLAINSYSQIPEIQWQKCYGSAEMDKTYGIAAKNNGYLIAIHVGTDGPGITNYHGLGDIWVVNSDSTGNIIWEKCFGGSNGDVPQKIVKKSENEYFIYGYTFSIDGDVQSGNNGYSDLWVVKINGLGGIIWEQTYGCTGYDDPRDMILTPDGGFVMIDRIGIGGGDVTNFYGSGDVWMCKCDSLGNIVWEKTLGNEGLDNCMSMIVNNEGNILMIGATQKHGGLVECYPDEAWGDVWIVELDLQGNILSQHCYGGSYYDIGIDIEEIEDGFVFVAGTTSNDGDVSGLHGPPGGPPDGWGDYWVVKTDDSGDIVWQKCLGGYHMDNPYYITQTEDDGFVILGFTISNDGDVSGNHSWSGAYDTDIWAVKLDSTGEIEWQHCYGGWGSERLENPNVILKNSDYNYVIASSTDYVSDDVQCDIHANWVRDAWIFEIDMDDTTGFYDIPALKHNLRVFPNPATNYVVFELPATIINNNKSAAISTPWESQSAGRRNLPKYMDPAGKPQGTNSGNGMSHAYTKSHPKGFDMMTAREEAVVAITNIFGQRVETLHLKSRKTAWDTRQVKSGVYFYNVEIDGKVFSGKIVLQN